jgi:hypothetical protein
LHRGSAGEKAFLNNLRESQSEAGKSATSSALSEDYLLQARSRGSVYPENSAVHLFYGKMDTDHKEKGSKRRKGIKLLSWYLHPQRRTERSLSQRWFHSTLTSSSSEEE